MEEAEGEKRKRRKGRGKRRKRRGMRRKGREKGRKRRGKRRKRKKGWRRGGKGEKKGRGRDAGVKSGWGGGRRGEACLGHVKRGRPSFFCPPCARGVCLRPDVGRGRGSAGGPRVEGAGGQGGRGGGGTRGEGLSGSQEPGKVVCSAYRGIGVRARSELVFHFWNSVPL